MQGNYNMSEYDMYSIVICTKLCFRTVKLFMSFYFIQFFCHAHKGTGLTSDSALCCKNELLFSP